jgi:hypothetical protein
MSRWRGQSLGLEGMAGEGGEGLGGWGEGVDGCGGLATSFVSVQSSQTISERVPTCQARRAVGAQQDVLQLDVPGAQSLTV